MNNPIAKLRERSGAVDSDDPLVSLLYSLLRDHVQPGVLESLVIDIEVSARFHKTTTQYTNGWLASYAQDLADRIRASKDPMILPELTKADALQITEARALILANKGRQRVISAYRAERALYSLLEDAVHAWADSPRPDIRVVLAELARIRAFRAMLRDLPPPSRGRKGSDAGKGMARDRRDARRRGGRR